MADMSKVEMGACSITAGGVEVGHTAGPVVLRFEPIWRPRREEKYGQSLVDAAFLGSLVTVSARFEEKTLANLKRALPYGLEGTGALGEGRAPGVRLSSLAMQLKLHPLECSGTEKDVTIHRAAAYGPVEIEFQEGKERSFLILVVGLVDTTQADGRLHATLNQP